MQNSTVRQGKPLKLQKLAHNLCRVSLVFQHCLRGFWWFLLTLGKVTLFLLSLLLSVALVVIPLWYLSTTYPRFYGYLVLGLLGLGILLPLSLRMYRTWKHASKEELVRQLGARARRVGFILMEVFLFLGAFRFYKEGSVWIAIGIAFVFLLALGFSFYRFHETQG